MTTLSPGHCSDSDLGDAHNSASIGNVGGERGAGVAATALMPRCIPRHLPALVASALQTTLPLPRAPRCTVPRAVQVQALMTGASDWSQRLTPSGRRMSQLLM